MKKNYKNSLVISVVATIALGIGSQAFASQARALFLSTAGAQVTYKEAKKAETMHKVYAYQPKEHKVYYQKVSETIPAGLSVQVMKVSRNGSAFAVDPSVYRFRNGDEFVVSFESNTPGYVRVYNINPSGDVNYLGTYAVPAFMRVQLPNSGYFKFTGERGNEKLVLELYPCKYRQTSDPNYGDEASNSNGYGRVSDTVLNSLPSCEPTQNGLKVGSTVVAYNDPNMSRDIVLANSNVQYSSYDNGATYYVSRINTANIKPITAVLNFIHK
ncbi:MAG: DUF4384 domain-containing protein [Hydrogenobaculum sp.]